MQHNSLPNEDLSKLRVKGMRYVGQLAPEPQFDIMYWLKRHRLIGQLTHANDLPPDIVFGQKAPRVKGINPPIYGLMVPLTIAVQELRNNVTEAQLRKFCEDKEIFLGDWLSKDKAAIQFQAFKEKILKKRQRSKEVFMSDIQELALALMIPDTKIVSGKFCEGSSGSVAILEVDRDDNELDHKVYDYIAFADTKRQFSAIKSQFEFMTLISTMEYHLNGGYSGRWQMTRLPTPDEAEIIRKYLGFKKRREQTDLMPKEGVNDQVLAA